MPPLPAHPAQAELDNGASIAALRRFNDLLANLPAGSWGEAEPAGAVMGPHGKPCVPCSGICPLSVHPLLPLLPGSRPNTLALPPPAPALACPAEAALRPVMCELAYNLESFNPAFTAVLLRVQQTIGVSDYVRRDTALKSLIQPLAGEYGMHNNEAQGERGGAAGGRGGGPWKMQRTSAGAPRWPDMVAARLLR